MLDMIGLSLPYQVSELCNLRFVLGIELELFLRLDKHSVLEPTSSKHDSSCDAGVLTYDPLCGN